MSLRIGIITPTYSRNRLLKRFIHQICRQHYQNWRLVVVHDGPNPETQAMVAQFASQDQRITYLELETRANDSGTTPRFQGANYLATQEQVDYLVFWDDDNSFRRDALAQINADLLTKGCPKMLLVPFWHENKLLPPQPIDLDQIHAGLIDSANPVVRAELGAKCFAQVVQQIQQHPEKAYISDFLFFAELREYLPPSEILFATNLPAIGTHDGLRLIQGLRWALRIPSLRLGRYAWYRQLKRNFYDWL